MPGRSRGVENNAFCDSYGKLGVATGSSGWWHTAVETAGLLSKNNKCGIAHAGVISGQTPLPIPKGCKVWHGPIDKPKETVGS